LGIKVIPSAQAIPGLSVTGFNPGSLAAEAGLRVGDLIVSIDGRPTRSAAEIGQLLSERSGGERVLLRVVRNQRMSAIEVPLIGGSPASVDSGAIATDSTKPNPAPATVQQPEPPVGAKAFGLQYTDIDGQRGALVTSVEKGTPASTSGLQTGDRIVAVDGRLLVDALALKQVLDQRPAGAAVDIRMVREGKLLSALIDPALPVNQSLAADDPASDDPKKKTALGGVGALLGGLLGGKPSSKAESKDEMALGDDEAVRQVDFEAEIEGGDPDRTPDPLSLEALELPPKSEPTKLVPAESDADKTVEQLRKEIAELERRLKELKEKKK
jgi:membrane-associated protease RseP (regulator of RpoE activity)